MYLLLDLWVLFIFGLLTQVKWINYAKLKMTMLLLQLVGLNQVIISLLALTKVSHRFGTLFIPDLCENFMDIWVESVLLPGTHHWWAQVAEITQFCKETYAHLSAKWVKCLVTSKRSADWNGVLTTNSSPQVVTTINSSFGLYILSSLRRNSVSIRLQ